MGSLKILALAGVMAFGGSAMASAADLAPLLPPPPEPVALRGTIGSGWYLRGDVGVGVQSIDKFYQEDVQAFGGQFFGKTEESAFFGGVGIGYRFNNWFRVDGTWEYRGASQIGVSDKLFNPFANGNQTNTYKGNLSSMVALFNAYVDLGTWNCLTPYIGAGIGVAQNRISGLTDQGIVFANEPFGPVSSTLGTAGTGTKSGLAWALMAGLGYEVNKNLTLELGYRYLNLGDAQSGVLQNAFLAESYRPLKAKDIQSHDFRIGMRWNFGDPDCCAAPAPIAYQAPVVRKY
ncbi:outer membrane protein [Bosea sp. 2KB_26]|uniref:outer membrane protein n=1 Tax=Bosea sp. 2KB_26 TaxID=3237475 RepID=UPI000DE4A10B